MSDTVYNAFEEKNAAWIQETVNDVLRRKMEYMHKDLIKMIEENDFITGSIDTQSRLKQILPEANVIYSPYVQDPTLVYVVKKFNGADLIEYLLKEPYPYKKEEQILNGFTEMMKGFWDNPNLEVPKED